MKRLAISLPGLTDLVVIRSERGFGYPFPPDGHT